MRRPDAKASSTAYAPTAGEVTGDLVQAVMGVMVLKLRNALEQIRHGLREGFIKLIWRYPWLPTLMEHW